MATKNPTPKETFLSNRALLEKHNSLLERPEFEAACHFGLLEYQRVLSQSTVPFQDAAANHYKMTGALEFLAVLKNLSSNPTRPTTVDRDNLQHQQS